MFDESNNLSQAALEEHTSPVGKSWNPGSNFAWLAPKTLLRCAEFFFTVIALLCIATVEFVGAYEMGVHTFTILIFTLFYIPAIMVVDWANLYTLKPRLIHQLEFAFDFLFLVVMFCNAWSLANWCNSRSDVNEAMATCACLDGSACGGGGQALSNMRSCVAFSFLCSFCFIPSTVFSYRFVASF
jgi:hypothetical protein